MAGRAKLHGSQIEHIGSVGQSGQLLPIEQFAADRVNSCCLKLLLKLRRRKPGHTDDAPPHPRSVARPPGHHRQARPNLAAHTQNNQVPLQVAHHRDEFRRRPAEQFLELLDVRNRFR